MDTGSTPVYSTRRDTGRTRRFDSHRIVSTIEPGVAKIVPKLKSNKELAVLEAFKALGFIANTEE